MQSLKDELKILIVDSLELEDVSPDEIDSAEPIFGEGLGLDSIDALELGIAIRKKYNITFPEDKAENRKIFSSVDALSEFIGSSVGSKQG